MRVEALRCSHRCARLGLWTWRGNNDEPDVGPIEYDDSSGKGGIYAYMAPYATYSDRTMSDATIFWFVLIFTMPSFSGEAHPEVEVKITTQTLDGCERLQKVVVRELRDRRMEKFILKTCPDGREEEP